MSLRKDAVKTAAGLLGRWFDSIAERRPKGLVARFRKRFGRQEPQKLGETADEYVQRIVKEANERRGSS